jgi:hypothetical protein
MEIQDEIDKHGVFLMGATDAVVQSVENTAPA